MSAMKSATRPELAADRQRQWARQHLPLFAAGCLPGGLLYAFAASGLWIPALISLVVFIALAATVHFRTRGQFSQSMGVEEYFDSDYTTKQKALMFATHIPWGLLIPAPVAFLTPETLNLAIRITAITILATAGLCAQLYFSTVRYLGVGRRRIQQVLEKDDLGGVTSNRLEQVEKHRAIMVTMMSLGAGDGVTIPMPMLARHLNTQPAELKDDLQELDRAQLVKVNSMGVARNPQRWALSLRPLGIRCTHQLRTGH